MIIREHKDSFIMIEQHHHAHISKKIINKWTDFFLNDDPLSNSVLYAIKMHDFGWDSFDRQPFWNDKVKSPFSFIDFPILPKLTLYTEGVNQVELIDPYAAALCSAHYINFLKNHSTHEVMTYINKENARIKRISSSFPTMTKEIFNRHLALLKFADNISLYVCLNDPGVAKSEEHFFFKEGIPISKEINPTNKDLIDAYWINDKTISLKGLPYIPSFSILLKQKKLLKKDIEKTGFIDQYQSVPYENKNITFNIS